MTMIPGKVVDKKSGKIHIPENELRKLIEERGLTYKKAGEHFGVSGSTISNRVEEYGIESHQNIGKAKKDEPDHDVVLNRLDKKEYIRVLRKDLNMDYKQITKLVGLTNTERVKQLCIKHGYDGYIADRINPLHLFVLYFVMELSDKEIADIKGCSVSHVRSNRKMYGITSHARMNKEIKWRKHARELLNDLSPERRAELRYNEKEELDKWADELREAAVELLESES